MDLVLKGETNVDKENNWLTQLNSQKSNDIVNQALAEGKERISALSPKIPTQAAIFLCRVFMIDELLERVAIAIRLIPDDPCHP